MGGNDPGGFLHNSPDHVHKLFGIPSLSAKMLGKCQIVRHLSAAEKYVLIVGAVSVFYVLAIYGGGQEGNGVIKSLLRDGDDSVELLFIRG